MACSCTNMLEPYPSVHPLNPQRATKPSGTVIRGRTVVIHEDVPVAAIAKKGTAKFSNIRWCLHPARRFRIETFKFLQCSILFFC